LTTDVRNTGDDGAEFSGEGGKQGLLDVKILRNGVETTEEGREGEAGTV
jgi:hypothetical protein